MEGKGEVDGDDGDDGATGMMRMMGMGIGEPGDEKWG